MGNSPQPGSPICKPLRILCLAHRVPHPPNRGYRIRSFHLLQFLARRATVDLAFLTHEPLAEASRAALQSMCRRVAWAPLHPWGRWLSGARSLIVGKSVTEGAFRSARLRSQLAAWSGATRYDAVFVFCSSMVPYLDVLAAGPGKTAPPGEPGCPVWVDLVDVDSQKWVEYAASARGLKRWLYAWEARRLRHLEKTLAGRVQTVTLVSSSEAALYRQVLGTHAEADRAVRRPTREEGTASPSCQIVPLPNGVDLEFFRPAPASPVSAQPPVGPDVGERGKPAGAIVFVGALDYPANIDGIDWFCRHVWWPVRQRYPDLRLEIVGSQPGPAIRRWTRLPGVELVGQVPDVRPHLAAALVVIVPLRIARGIQNKVLEAMAMGKPVLASPGALEGLHVQIPQQAACASTPEEWLHTLGNLLGDPEERARLGAAGRAYVEQHHGWEPCLAGLEVLLSELEAR